MQQYQQALDEATQQHSLDRVRHALEHEPRYLLPVPPASRDRLKAHLDRRGREIFALGFTGRFFDLHLDALEKAYQGECVRLRQEIHAQVREWDRRLKLEGKPSQLARTYPWQGLCTRLEKEFDELWEAGKREGYRARMRRLASEVSHGMARSSAEALLAQEGKQLGQREEWLAQAS